MDLTLEIIIVASSLFLAALVACLDIVGFGRAAIVAATTALLSLAISLGCLQRVGAIWDAPPPANSDVLSSLARSERLLEISRSLLAVALLAAFGFCVAGVLRVWRRRCELFARLGAQHVAVKTSAVSPGDSAWTARDSISVGILLLALMGMVIWELFEFAVTHRGLQYYREHPGMLLFAVGGAAALGVVFVALCRYARKHAPSRSDECCR